MTEENKENQEQQKQPEKQEPKPQVEQGPKKNWHEKHYKLLLLIPLAMFAFSMIYLVNFNAQNGDIILKDVSLTGGTTITVFDKGLSLEDLKTSLTIQFPDLIARQISDIRTGEQQAITLETSADVDEIKPALEEFLGYTLNQENSSIEFTGSSLSTGFYQQLRIAIIVAFVFMALVVFIIFRSPIPSLTIVLAALADMIFTLVTINLLGISLSIAGIVAFLMLIGYSVDTNILLTTKVIKRKEGSLNERMLSAFKTGIMMTLTSIVAILVALIIIYSFSDILKQVFTILLIGLGFDIFNTWITNTCILRWYSERRNLN